MLNFTLYTSNVRGDKANCLYPNRIEISNRSEFANAMQYDHVCGAFRNNYRSNGNFLESNVLAMDCDNDHSDLPTAWVYPEDVAKAFPEVAFTVNYSRNHMKAKGTKSARPRFHIYFPIPTIVSGREYNELKKKIQEHFPYFDEGALGEARFFFGTESPMVDIHEGTRNVASFISGTELVKKNEDSSLEKFSEFDALTGQIPEGSRNSTMSRIAARIIKRYGNTEETYAMFLEASEKCNPPLEDTELKQIWNSACKFGQKISKDPNYIPPDVYNSQYTLKPEDYSDFSQAVVFAREYNEKIRYTTSTEFLVYNGSYWEESYPKAKRLSQELTVKQMDEVDAEIHRLVEILNQNGALNIMATTSPRKAMTKFTPEQVHHFNLYEKALEYKKFITARRDDKKIEATLKEAFPMVDMKTDDFDQDEFALNCPAGTYDLRKGLDGFRNHNWEDFITMETLMNPGTKGAEIWQAALNTFFKNDKELIEYVQKIVGLSCIGKVFVEALIIAYGEGRNGKSTFWNTISRVLGRYSGTLSTDVILAGINRNIRPEIAESKGKRLIIISELEEGVRMSTANIKKLCSTDSISAEKKYKTPFFFIPQHTLVLYTNHLPKVRAIDQGTWRRLIVVPFNAVIEGDSDIKNYTEYLVNNAGEAVLAWIIEGAKKVIDAKYKIAKPAVVKKAIGKYRDNNDWLGTFMDECCVIEHNALQKSGEFYNAYRAHCLETGEHTRGTIDFYAALESRGFERHKTNKGAIIEGIRLRANFED